MQSQHKNYMTYQNFSSLCSHIIKIKLMIVWLQSLIKQILILKVCSMLPLINFKTKSETVFFFHFFLSFLALSYLIIFKIFTKFNSSILTKQIFNSLRPVTAIGHLTLTSHNGHERERVFLPPYKRVGSEWQ